MPGSQENECQIKRKTLREDLAEYAHKAWSGWMKYLFEKSKCNKDGTFTIPRWAVHRWAAQTATPYKNLSEEEKNSDREEADMMIKIMEEDKNA